MLIHHVLFWMKDPTSLEDKNNLLEGLNSLKEIPIAKITHIGTPASTDRPVIDRSYQFSLMLIFEDMKAHNTYQKHPLHLKFIENCSSLWSKVLIYDAESA